jgi:hypothetical protein
VTLANPMAIFWVVLAAACVLAGLFIFLSLTPQKRASQHGAMRPLGQQLRVPEPAFNCRISVRPEQSKTGPVPAFAVEIKGLITAPSDNHDTRLRVTIDDLSDGQPQPVRCASIRHQKGSSGIFLYEEPNGRIPQCRTELANWVTVASLPVAMFTFARKGQRRLSFRVALVSCETGEMLAAAKTQFVYTNENLGYEDASTNNARTRQLGVTIALAMAIADDDVADAELSVIKNWAASKLGTGDNDDFVPDAQLDRQLEKALHQAIKFFSTGGRIDIRALCSEIIDLAPESERFELIRLCVSVARADGQVTEPEMELLNRLGLWLLLDRTKLRQMFEQLIPDDISTFKNPDAVLGITSDMDPELIRRYLNEEYRRWNARVTNSDPNVRQRAERVMAMIAEARQKYVKEKSPSALHTIASPKGD